MRSALPLLVALAALVSCGGDGASATPRPPIERVLADHTDRLMALPGVTGTAQGQEDGAPCIYVLAVARSPELERALPPSIEGYPVVLRAVGDIEAR